MYYTNVKNLHCLSNSTSYENYTNVKNLHCLKKGLVVKILGRTNRRHSKLVRDFSKKFLTNIFGCPKLHAHLDDMNY